MALDYLEEPASFSPMNSDPLLNARFRLEPVVHKANFPAPKRSSGRTKCRGTVLPLKVEEILARRKRQNKLHEHNSSAHLIKCLYDIRVVWPLEIRPRLAPVASGSGVLGHRAI